MEIMPYLVLYFVLYATAAILFCYCASFLFSKVLTATAGLPIPFAMVSKKLFTVSYAVFIS